MKIGINGFGRTGRCAFRAALASGVEVAKVNGTRDPKTLAHLLKYDSSYGTLPQEVIAGNNSLTVDGKSTALSFEREPRAIDWGEVDVVLECSGKFRERSQVEGHLKGGAQKVIIGAPAKGEDVTVVLGVNDHQLKEDHTIISNASCTTNCLAPVAKVLDEGFGIEQGLMTTVHAYTGDQRLLDGTHKDLRRARSAGLSMIPTTTGAAVAVAKVLPQLAGKLTGFAVRVPTPVVSFVDLTVTLNKEASAEEVNDAFRMAAGKMKGILQVCDEPLVSSDFVGNSHSAIIDSLSTLASGRLVKVLAWYDNEWAYAQRLVELAQLVGGKR